MFLSCQWSEWVTWYTSAGQLSSKNISHNVFAAVSVARSTIKFYLGANNHHVESGDAVGTKLLVVRYLVITYMTKAVFKNLAKIPHQKIPGVFPGDQGAQNPDPNC